MLLLLLMLLILLFNNLFSFILNFEEEKIYKVKIFIYF